MAPLEQAGIESAETPAQETPLWQRHPYSRLDSPNGVWTYDFVHDQLANGGPLKMLCVLDEQSPWLQISRSGQDPFAPGPAALTSPTDPARFPADIFSDNSPRPILEPLSNFEIQQNPLPETGC
jgi:hypothetical protein